MGVYTNKARALMFILLVLPINGISEETVAEGLECLALNIYFEGRNQPWIGKVAIGQVTVNRVLSSKFPNTICGVVHQGGARTCQFSWWCDGKSDTPLDNKAMESARKVAIFVYSGAYPDVTEGALWYHANYINLPFWAKKYKETVRINEHLFYTR